METASRYRRDEEGDRMNKMRVLNYAVLKKNGPFIPGVMYSWLMILLLCTVWCVYIWLIVVVDYPGYGVQLFNIVLITMSIAKDCAAFSLLACEIMLRRALFSSQNPPPCFMLFLALEALWWLFTCTLHILYFYFSRPCPTSYLFLVELPGGVSVSIMMPLAPESAQG